ncbi:MAG: hypothetical protein IOD12_00410, partial [Silvanigrellales bacterium]|nr:hypothetical protein [Silvanigrellales bacterium]
ASREGDKDTFDSSTRVIHLSLGMLHKESRLYAALLMGHKSTTSKLFIKEDDTELSLDDTLSDAKVPLLAQSTVGWVSPFGMNAALSFLYVPNRLFMPRLSLGYVHTFVGGAKTTPAGAPPEGEAASDAPSGSGGVPREAPPVGTGTAVPQSPGASSSTLEPAGDPAAAPAVVSPGAATPGKGKAKGAPRKQRRAPGAKPQPSSVPVTP